MILFVDQTVDEWSDAEDHGQDEETDDEEENEAASGPFGPLLDDAAPDVQHVAEPERRGRVEHEDNEEVVDLLEEVVGQDDRDFDRRSQQQPNLDLVYRFVSSVVPHDVLADAHVDHECLRDHDTVEDVVEDFSAHAQVRFLAVVS